MPLNITDTVEEAFYASLSLDSPKCAQMFIDTGVLPNNDRLVKMLFDCTNTNIIKNILHCTKDIVNYYNTNSKNHSYAIIWNLFLMARLLAHVIKILTDESTSNNIWPHRLDASKPNTKDWPNKMY